MRTKLYVAWYSEHRYEPYIKITLPPPLSSLVVLDAEHILDTVPFTGKNPYTGDSFRAIQRKLTWNFRVPQSLHFQQLFHVGKSCLLYTLSQLLHSAISVVSVKNLIESTHLNVNQIEATGLMRLYSRK